MQGRKSKNSRKKRESLSDKQKALKIERILYTKRYRKIERGERSKGGVVREEYQRYKNQKLHKITGKEIQRKMNKTFQDLRPSSRYFGYS